MSRRRTRKKDLSERLPENMDIVFYTVLGVFVLAYMGFPLIKQNTTIEHFPMPGGGGNTGGGGGW